MSPLKPCNLASNALIHSNITMIVLLAAGEHNALKKLFFILFFIKLLSVVWIILSYLYITSSKQSANLYKRFPRPNDHTVLYNILLLYMMNLPCLTIPKIFFNLELVSNFLTKLLWNLYHAKYSYLSCHIIRFVNLFINPFFYPVMLRARSVFTHTVLGALISFCTMLISVLIKANTYAT